MKRNQIPVYLLLPLIFLLLYHGVFNNDFAYLDEAQQLWRHHDGSNFEMFFVQGRVLTGLLLEWLFGSVDTIAGLKTIRILSLLGWITTAAVFYHYFRRWMYALNLDPAILLPTMVLFASLPALAITVGWASCAEIFLATLLGLFSGGLVFNSAMHPAQLLSIRFIPALACGLMSLFLYQNAFGIFLLPFILCVFAGKELRLKKILLTGLLFYTATYGIYYLLFEIMLQQMDSMMATRAALSADPIRKLSFFFSGPLPMAFSLNLFYHTRSVLMQVFAPLMMVAFTVSLFLRNRGKIYSSGVGRLVLLMGMLMLLYLPSMLVAENFSSYRTLFPFSLTVGIVMFIQLFHFLQGGRTVKIAGAVLSLSIALIGYLNFNRAFVRPVNAEYTALRDFVHQSMKKNTRTIVFIRPGKHIFRQLRGIHPIRDEFGLASTSRDWVPDPLMRQLVMEETGDRSVAERLTIHQFGNSSELDDSGFVSDSSTLVINMDSLLESHPTQASGF